MQLILPTKKIPAQSIPIEQTAVDYIASNYQSAENAARTVGDNFCFEKLKSIAGGRIRTNEAFLDDGEICSQ